MTCTECPVYPVQKKLLCNLMRFCDLGQDIMDTIRHIYMYNRHTECPRGRDQFFIVTNNVKWVKISWIDSMYGNLYLYHTVCPRRLGTFSW